MQTVSTERGKDPRDFVLMPFGGAGPLGVTEIADELGIRKVLVPPNPGVMSAFGLLASDYKLIDVAPLFGVVSAVLVASLRATVAGMVAKAAADFVELGVDGEPVSKIMLDMRYRGQAFELQVPMTRADIEALTEEKLVAAFQSVYADVFMDAVPGARPVELVSVRLLSTNLNRAVPRLSWSSSLESGETGIRVRRRGRTHDCREITVDRLAVAAPVSGPALIVSDTSSVFVDDGWRVTRDTSDNLILEVTR